MLSRIDFFLILIFFHYVVEEYFRRRFETYRMRGDLRKYNLREESVGSFIGPILFLLIVAFVVGYYRFELRYFYYPFFNLFFGICVFLIASLITWFSIRRRAALEHSGHAGRAQHFGYSLLATVAVSLVFGSIQFSIYYFDRDAYAIDSNLLTTQIRTDTIDFDNRIDVHEFKITKAVIEGGIHGFLGLSF